MIISESYLFWLCLFHLHPAFLNWGITPVIRGFVIVTFGLWLNSISSTTDASKSVRSKIASTSYKLAIVIVVGGFIMKLLHFPGAITLILLGLVSVAVWFVSDMIVKKSINQQPLRTNRNDQHW
ncbi:MAG: hypothetical protein HRT57_17075 [Crocinitomicaceae bacterium]|nr:hypothetical protein [Crocinitomicaceae bacterium]